MEKKMEFVDWMRLAGIASLCALFIFLSFDIYSDRKMGIFLLMLVIFAIPLKKLISVAYVSSKVEKILVRVLVGSFSVGLLAYWFWILQVAEITTNIYDPEFDFWLILRLVIQFIGPLVLIWLCFFVKEKPSGQEANSTAIPSFKGEENI